MIRYQRYFMEVMIGNLNYGGSRRWYYDWARKPKRLIDLANKLLDNRPDSMPGRAYVYDRKTNWQEPIWKRIEEK